MMLDRLPVDLVIPEDAVVVVADAADEDDDER